MKSFPIGIAKMPIFPPEAFFQELCFDNRDDFKRPAFHHVYRTVIYPQFDENLVMKCLDRVTGMTDGDIGFLLDPNNPTLQIRLDPTITSRLASTALNVENHCIKSARIAYHDLEYAGYPQPLLHELGHTLGLNHVQPPWNIYGDFIMGAGGKAGLNCWDYNPFEKLAWKRLLSRPLPI